MVEKIIIAVFVLFLGCAPAFAAEQGAEAPAVSQHQSEEAGDGVIAKSSSGLPIPRFVALADDKVIARTGPGLKYPIKWIYERKRMPVEVVQEFDTWRKIRDIDGAVAWVHQSLLSGARAAIVKGEKGVSLRKDPEEDAPILAYFEPNVVVSVKSCEGAWCAIESGGYEGYAQRKFLWGIYDQEDFD